MWSVLESESLCILSIFLKDNYISLYLLRVVPPINLGKTTKFVTNFTKLQLLNSSTLHSFELFKFLLTQTLSEGPSSAHIEVFALIDLYTDILNWELSPRCPCVDNLILW